MDSQDHSAPPHRYPLQPLLGQYTQHQLNNSYPFHNSDVVATMPTSMGHQQQNPLFPFNSMLAQAAPNPVEHHYFDGSPSGVGRFGTEPQKKKRGRPRKYSPDNSIGLGLSPTAANQVSSTVGLTNSSGGDGTQATQAAAKRGRGRPPGSVKKQLDALGVPGVGFTPHVITVDEDEDVASKIMEFSRQGPRTVCILSAIGSISNVTLRQSATSGGTISYQGRFEIISLSGYFPLSENTDDSNLGSLRVSLAGSDGRVLGGAVAGTLKAATSVQIVAGSFVADGKKSKSRLSSPPSSQVLNFSAPMAGVSLSPAASSESAEENGGSPPNHSLGPYGNASQSIQNMHMFSHVGWPNSVNMNPS